MDRPDDHTRESQRLINRRRQGDLGEASAIDWLTRQGATVWAPLGHSPTQTSSPTLAAACYAFR